MNITEQSFTTSTTMIDNQQLSCNNGAGNNPSGQSCTDDIVLDCGKPVNFTYYDNLLGVANRNKHPLVPEPAVVLMFKKSEEKVTDFDIDLLERRLKRAKREVRELLTRFIIILKLNVTIS